MLNWNLAYNTIKSQIKIYIIIIWVKYLYNVDETVF